MAHHEVGTRINRRVGNLHLVVQYLVIQAPVMAGDDDVCPAAERRHVLTELHECSGVCPGHDLWRHAGTGQCSELLDLGPIGRMRLERCDAWIVCRSLVSV